MIYLFVTLSFPGIALLYLHLHDVFKEESFLHKALDYVSRSLQCLTRRHDVTFLCGDAGPLAVAAVVYSRMQRAQEASDCISRWVWWRLKGSRPKQCQSAEVCFLVLFRRLAQYHKVVVDGSSGLPDELLYGRVGYLYSLVFVNQQLGGDRIPGQFIQQVRLGLSGGKLENLWVLRCHFPPFQISETVLASGELLSRKFRVQNQSPLMFEWYQEQYVGAAHGLAGIYYFLMQVFRCGGVAVVFVEEVVQCSLRFYRPPQPGFVPAVEHVHRLVKPSVDHVCRLKLPSGNYPPCIGDERDLLVHWCHGSPGVIYMLLQAHKVNTRRRNRRSPRPVLAVA